MPIPTLSTYTDPQHHAVVIVLSGAVTDSSAVPSMQEALHALPIGHGLIVDVSDVTRFTGQALDGLRLFARSATATGQRLAFVCTSLELRTELVLADLDCHAPVVHAVEQAFPLVRSVA